MLRLIKENEQKLLEKEMKKLGMVSKMTAFSKLLGGINCNDGVEPEYWMFDGQTNYSLKRMALPLKNSRNIGIRFAMDEKDIFFKNKIVLSDDIFEIEYGEYPKEIMCDEFRKNILRFDLEETGKMYHVNGRKLGDMQEGFLSKTLIEYHYQNCKFVEVKPNLDGKNLFINGERISYRKSLLFEVCPIKWLFFEKLGIAVTKDILVSGIKYDDIPMFLGIYFEREMLPQFDWKKQEELMVKERLQKIIEERKQLLHEESILWNELSLLRAKSFPKIQNEINEEYINQFGIGRLEFDSLLYKLYHLSKNFKIEYGNLSILQKLMITLKYEKGVSLADLENEFGADQKIISYNINLTKKLLSDVYER